MSQDAIVMLKKDHKEVRALFREIQRSSTTEARRGKLVDEAIELLSAHTHIEDEAMYPRDLALLPELEDVIEPMDAHHLADYRPSPVPLSLP